jgi:hypothetical protein
MPKGYKVGKEHPVPSLQELKQLFRWYIYSTKGRLDPEGRPTMKTTLIRAQEFVPGFALETGKPIAEEDAFELYRVSRPSMMNTILSDFGSGLRKIWWQIRLSKQSRNLNIISSLAILNVG